MSTSLNQAKSMLESYVDAMRHTATLLDSSFEQAVSTVANLRSILIVTGLGKSGAIAQKAAATFRSTGTQAAFVHPVEALHGDIGIVRRGSAILAISKSGANEETIEFVRQFKTIEGGHVITLSEPRSPLSEHAEIALSIPKLPEIDLWNLAPTTSTMTSMAICDVLSICVQQRKGLGEADFAQFHPSGSLGKRLLLNVSDFMVNGSAMPVQNADTSFAGIVHEISSKGLGLVLLTESDGTLFGMLTDGDIRRLMERNVAVLEMNGRECYAASRRGDDLPQVDCCWSTPETKASDCLAMMQDNQITSVVILNQDKPVGIVRLQDLVQAGL